MAFRPIDLVRLHSGISGMTPALIRSILEWSRDQAVPLADLFNLPESEMIALFAMKADVAALVATSTEEAASNQLEQLEKKGFQLLTFLDEFYPPQYAAFEAAMPPLLYVHGNPAILRKAGIGFGGARDVSNDGLYATDQLAQSVVKDHAYTVISGHAKGVDVMAHQAALAANGETVLVLPEGALVFRLNEALRAYWADAKERISIITQFAPKEPWSARNAMTRNATAICLSKAFCVIESGDEKGGTWEAGTTALNKGVPLYVLDYPEPPNSALGNRKLIAKKGIPIPYVKNHLKFPDVEPAPKQPEQRRLFE